ncbi:hypothetical protein PHAVU_L004801 [Phaseolus vulgaris]|uniref:Uncharacterized protein n=2 Tax=Phaseolus vulgaris TaxID=3885 RepID=A0ACC3P2E0_PHAVU
MIDTGRVELNPIQIKKSDTRVLNPENPFHSFSSPSPSPCVSPSSSFSESVDSSLPPFIFRTPNQLRYPHRLNSLPISVPSISAGRMKGGRSHRPQSSDPPDEWVDGSWTVDCICGVTFDDGEEMVKCDECGVWVHTRCSRYVKGDDTFACDKCKARHNNNPEETEVAQFLVELPTKTISMDNKKALPSRPRLWTDKPIQDRVHVQGALGGDPSIFSSPSVSSIFSPHLWKACGYVPKKFNFQYKEFPFWSENDDDGKDNVNESLHEQTQAQPQALDNNKNGAGTLVYLSKDGDNNGSALLLDPSSADARSGHAKETETGKFGSEDVPPRFHSEVKKERTLLRPPVVHHSKRSKGDFGSSNSKDRSGKKRVRTTSDREVDPRRRTLHSSKSVFTPTGEAKQVDFYEDRGPRILKADTRSIKNKNLKEIVVQECVSDDYLAADTIMEEPNNNLTTTEDSLEPLYPDMTRHGVSVVDVLAEEKPNHKPPTVVEMSSKTDDAVTSALNQNNVGNASAKEKDGDCSVADNADDSLVVRSAASPQTEGHCSSAPQLVDNQVSQDLDRMRTSSTKCKVKMKREDDIDNFKKPSIFHPSPTSDLKNNEKLSDHKSDVKVNEAPVPTLPSCENKVGSVDISSEVIPADHINKPNELSGDFCPRKQELEGYEGSLETQKVFSETKDGSDSAKDPSKSEALGCPPKVLACVGKSSPTSSTMNSKSLGHDIKSEDTETANPFTKHGVITDCSVQIKNENCISNVARDENPKKSVRERPKSSLNSNSKGLHSSRSVHNSVSKQASSDPRDSVPVSSKSLIHQTASILGSSESNASLPNQKVLQVQNKILSSAPQKVEKLNQTNTATSSKLNQGHVPSVNPSPISNSSMLSDEELALLLHQELNSSPRVPRVPRARHAGSLPQLSSASPTSMLMKRTSGGGKDHYLVSRRKHKDASRDGSGSSRELEDEAKKIEKEKCPSSSDQRKQDMSYMEDAPAREEGLASVTAANSITNNTVSSNSAIANSDPSSPPGDQNLSSMRNSPRNISDDDTATAGRPVHRTLPGLINEIIIMSKGRRMTYEELCNAVLPHWHNLRKHNGERYAYSSHSQAVLDCLRNRQEWARLVDRGPKTNSNRKRRKLEAEESDDNGYGKGRTPKEAEGKNFELQKEEFPKGKRKARKRRRLALQGRAVKDVRRRQKADSLTDEDVGPFSNSSEESMFSEDEIQVGRICPAGSTSDEAGSA